MPDILADYREWRQQQAARVSTHSDGCHMWHEQCMIHRLAAALAVEMAKRTPSEPSTPGEGTRQRECAEPVAWAVMGDGYEYVSMMPEMCGAWASENGGRTVPLYRSPTLTDAEREAIVTALAFLREEADEPGVAQDAATLRGLLERCAR
jgi:hypothetical protein